MTDTVTDQNTLMYVVSFAPDHENVSVGGYDYFYETYKNDALIHYGRMVYFSEL